MRGAKGSGGRKRDRTIGKTLQRARNIMYESVNELLRVRKTREGKMERGAIKERARSNVEITVQKRGGKGVR